MNSREYWRRREEEALKHYLKDEQEYERKLREIYRRSLDNAQKEIDSFYARYASKEGITISEAKKRVASEDVKAFERKAKKYVEEKNFSPQANRELRLYNATMRINRLEMLKANIGLELIASADELEKFMQDILKGRTEEELKRQAGILGKTVRNNAQTANSIINASFHNAKFSERIWGNQALLRADLDKALQTGLIQGKNGRELARDFRDRYQTSTYNAERLLRTELARVQTEAQKQEYERNGFEMYEFIANSGCCDACQALNGKHFKVADMMPGENAAPIHPQCRCATAPWEDSEEYEAWLDYLANGGTTEEWNRQKQVGNGEEGNRVDYTARRLERMRNRRSDDVDFENMSRDDLIEYANKKLLTNFDIPKGVSTDAIRSAVSVIKKFEASLGGKTIDGLSIRFVKGLRGVYAKFDDSTNSLLLPAGARPKAIAESQKAANIRFKTKWRTNQPYYATETFEGVIWHEIGHAVDVSTGQRLSKELSRTVDLDASSVRISAYAGSTQNVRVSKRSEAWAENYSAYMEGGQSRGNVPAEIVTMIEEYNSSYGQSASKYGRINKRASKLNLKRSEDIPTVRLPAKEYGRVMHELNTNLSDEERNLFIITKAIGDYVYTIENYGFDDYRIIGKELIDEK